MYNVTIITIKVKLLFVYRSTACCIALETNVSSLCPSVALALSTLCFSSPALVYMK